MDRTVSWKLPVASDGGSCALICVPDVINKGIGVVPSVTHVPPKTVGSVPVVGALASAARLRPLIDTRLFAATVVAPEAMFTVARGFNTGRLVAAGALSDTMLRPLVVKT